MGAVIINWLYKKKAKWVQNGLETAAVFESERRNDSVEEHG